ncbi:acyltransferase family protein [Kytococcus sedentarius]|uniref:acyltransferase family protein n=1 Tax=Kytococcus sedentarius TaxID=1276 RepID=UPI0035BC81D2
MASRRPVATGWSGPARGARQKVPGEGTQRRYLTGLDGLRAIAVVSVMLFHFDTGLDGGFLGVDVFFVLSGYLITSQLLTRWRDGQVDLKHFWTARIRRLFPAVALLLLVVSVVMLVLDRGGVRSYLGDVLAASTYTSNWWYVLAERSYFEAAGRPPVLQHLWSLAVEEQFYVIWPLVVAGLTFAFVRPGGRRWALLVLSVVGAVASSLWMGLGTAAADLPASGDTSRFYFGTDSHAMGLLTGAALAALRDGRGFSDRLPALRPAGPLWTLVGVAGLAGLGWYFVAMDETSEALYRWGFAALAVLVAVLVVVATRPGPVEWVLSLPPLRYLGTRSYSLYLWHWPIAAFTRPGIDVQWSEPVVMAVRWGLTLAAAELSYRLVENPVRRQGFRATWDRLRRTGRAPLTAASGLVTATAALAVGMTAVAVTTDPKQLEEQQVEEVLGDSEVGVVEDPSAGATDTGAGENPDSEVPPAPDDEATATGDSEPSAQDPAPSQDPSPSPSASGGKDAQCDPTKITGDRVSHGAEEKWLGESQLAVDTLPPGEDGLRLDDSTQCMGLTIFGDSVPMSAGPILSRAFGALDLRADVGVQSKHVLGFAQEALEADDVESEVVLIHTGNNGLIRKDDLLEVATGLAEKDSVTDVVLVRPHAHGSWDEGNQEMFDELESEDLDPKISIADWKGISADQPGWFLSDRTHPNYTGKLHYAQEVQRAVTEG